jgi:hypothetical protein
MVECGYDALKSDAMGEGISSRYRTTKRQLQVPRTLGWSTQEGCRRCRAAASVGDRRDGAREIARWPEMQSETTTLRQLQGTQRRRKLLDAILIKESAHTVMCEVFTAIRERAAGQCDGEGG